MMKSQKILVVALVVVFAATAGAQDLDSVLNNAINAMGGQAQWESIKTMSMTMSGVMQGSMNISMDMKIVKPNKFYMDMNMMGQEMTMISNGESTWMSMMGQVMDVPEAQANNNKQMTQGFGDMVLQMKQQGATYVGVEDFAGIACHAIQFTPEGQDQPSKVYFDQNTYLMTGLSNATPNGNVEMHIKNYVDVQGLKFPEKMDVLMNGSPMMEMTISNVKINPAIDDSLFIRK